MSERRYSEDEVAAIFQRATEAQQSARQLPAASGEGLTLSELQAIGRDVGIEPELVARAARGLDQPPPVPAERRFLGLPLGVGRTVELGRRLTEAEWEQLVVDLRQTFDARGSVRTDGSFRQWTNGNLQALLEPTPTGQRLRLKTVKGSSRSLLISGLSLTGIAAVTLFATALTGGLDWGTLSSTVILATGGLGMFGAGALRLPGWARERQQQMEAVSARLLQSVRSPAPESPESG